MLLKISGSFLLINIYLILSDLTKFSETFAHNCEEATEDSQTSGVYEIFTESYSEDPFKVYCDAETQGGGWTIILRRLDGSVDFFRNWNTYKKGFGEQDGEYFLGLDKIHALTSERSQQLLVVLEDFEENKSYELYERFAIGNEEEKYLLHTLGRASGTAGDSLRIHHGMEFSTYDTDHDRDEDQNCAEARTGAWWYNSCYESNLAGKYNGSDLTGIIWDSFLYGKTLKTVIMMIKPRK